MGSGSEKIKELLLLPETDTTPSSPIQVEEELLRAEKGETSGPDVVLEDPQFKKAATQYLNTPDKSRQDSYEPSKAPPIVQKNEGELATIIAAAQPKSKPARPLLKTPKIKPKPKTKPKTHQKSRPKKTLSLFRVKSRKKI